jgi:hypothetical protein
VLLLRFFSTPGREDAKAGGLLVLCLEVVFKDACDVVFHEGMLKLAGVAICSMSSGTVAIFIPGVLAFLR